MDDVKRLGSIQRKKHLYSVYDHTHIIAYLEKQAQEGWLLEEIGRSGWTYQAIEPQPLKFMLAYAPEAMEEATDWQLAAKSKDMHIFFSSEDAPAPAQINAVYEVEEMNSRFLVHLFPYLILPIVLLLQLQMRGGIGATGLGYLEFIWLFAPHDMLFWLIYILPCSFWVYVVVEFIIHWRWYSPALEIAKQQGVILATKDTAKKNKGWLVACGLLIAYATVVVVMAMIH